MDKDDVMNTFIRYEYLIEKAEEILKAGNIKYHGIDKISLDERGEFVDISYYNTCRGEIYYEGETVPIDWFDDKTDLKKVWEEKLNKKK
jgi:hypothetical protein